MGNDGGVVRLRALVITGELDTAVIVVVAARRTLVPLVQATGTSLDVVLGTVVPSPSAAYRGATIDFGGVVTLHITHPFIAVADPVTGRFVASRHHQERRVMTVFVDDAPRLFSQVFVNLHAPTQLHAVIGPRGAFRLQVNAHLVGSGKGCLGRTIAVEAHVVQAVLLDLAEDFHPRILVCGWITRLWETAVLHRTAQEERTSVDIQLASFNTDFAQSEDKPVVIVACLQNQLVESRAELIPQLDGVRQFELQHFILAVDALTGDT